MTTNEDSGDQTAAVLAGRLDGLVRRWKKEAEAYQAQVSEAMAKGLPYDQMMSGATRFY